MSKYFHVAKTRTWVQISAPFLSKWVSSHRPDINDHKCECELECVSLCRPCDRQGALCPGCSPPTACWERLQPPCDPEDDYKSMDDWASLKATRSKLSVFHVHLFLSLTTPLHMSCFGKGGGVVQRRTKTKGRVKENPRTGRKKCVCWDVDIKIKA